ncbi:PIG-L family deacetylase [Isoptericola sp. NEAU-Y5]|uniref:PIG-L family deacetylase n=1 Tax=Isoptericola luteus TaxID=2879484 RepID=A0ABS7ZBH3_9MICO|nr:PIG-L family deacetylase [Isoptericola sp. NEAU-Y5]MCA5892398.1 PIG-L family deacetylase [Isoptericola sp. NEAU-Y5]
MAPSGRLLAVHAHPDDETLATGALLATWAAAGEPVAVVTCTRGERGEVIDTPSHPTGVGQLEGDGPALAAHRERELAGALAALGVHEHLFLDSVPAPGAGDGASRLEDSGMSWVSPGVAGPADDAPATAFSRVPLDESARRLAAVVRAWRPDVVATYEPGGGYGHPDHVRTHDVAARALELAANGGAALPGDPWTAELWEAVVPESEARAARRALAADPAVRRLATVEGLDLPDAAGPLPPVAKRAVELAGRQIVRIEVAPVLDALLAAMRAHATQVQHVAACAADDGDGPVLLGRYALSNAVLAPIGVRETYVRRARVGSPR